MKQTLLHAVVFFVISIYVSTTFAQSGSVRGSIFDTEGDPLPSANVYISEFGIGAAADFDGRYNMRSVPAGEHVMRVSYIGYEIQEVPVTVLANQTTELDITLEPQVVAGDTVIVYGQASAQMQAINQQINSSTIKNIVSSKSIQELPESNAAEAVGRLPGVSLLRDGGEGNKVVIRGMAPKYSKVQIDGVNISATGQNDRSSDLSMISPYMLDGIELTKSVMADQEGDATGGIVNFRIKEAPAETQLNAVVEGGYNGLKDTYDDYKLSVGGSHRFFDQALGVYAQVNLENKNTSAERMGGIWFYKDGPEIPVETRTVNFYDNLRDISRFGATLVLDYSLENTKFKISSFNSLINREETNYSINYNIYDRSLGKGFSESERDLFISTNSFKIEHTINEFTFEGGASFSLAENDQPFSYSTSISPSANQVLIQNVTDFQFDPREAGNKLAVPHPDSLNWQLGGLSHTTSYTRESEYAFDFSAKYQTQLMKDFSFSVKVGARAKHKDKKYDQWGINASNGGGPDGKRFRNTIIDLFRDQLSEKTISAYDKATDAIIPFDDFIDPDYEGQLLMDDQYAMGEVLDKDMMRTFAEILLVNGVPKDNLKSQIPNDYWGYEDYYAVYILPEFKVGESLTIIPGVRYENNRTEYTAMRAETRAAYRDYEPFPVDTTTRSRQNDFVLPMFQVLYKPVDWLILKGGYTKTLQRPNYTSIIPRWEVVQRDGHQWRNFRLKPERAENFDLQATLFSDEIGLFSVSVFHKTISDMVFFTDQRAVLDPEAFELPDYTTGFGFRYHVNNESDVTNYGYELEWKSNFYWLPGLLNGLVVNFNYTRNFSEADYLRTQIKSTFDPMTGTISYVNNDTTYSAPMVLQPDHLLNFSIGYDYKGFSIRYALRYKSNIFTSVNWYEDLRGYSEDFIRHDLSMKQLLPIEGMEAFLDIYNLTDEHETDTINFGGYPTSEEYYGMLINLGLRFRY